MKRIAGMTAVAVTLAACGSAVGRIPTDALGISARDAYVEARSVARSWVPDAELRWVEGVGIGADGIARPQVGSWEFHYTAPGQTRELFVRVDPLESAAEERPVTGPPGYVIGDNALGASWIDSREAAAAVAAEAPAGLTGSLSLLLVPMRPAQWVIESEDGGVRWRVHAETGEVLER